MDWFRFYNETQSDPKLRRIARDLGTSAAEIIGIWAIVMCKASESPERGKLLIAPGVPVTLADIEEDADGPQRSCNVAATLQLCCTYGMLSQEGDTWCLANWDKRQFSSDSSTDRSRKSRQKAQNPGENDQRNVAATLQQRSRNAPDTDTEVNHSTNGASAPTEPSAAAGDPLLSCLEYLKTEKPNRQAAMARLFTLRFGVDFKPDYGRLGKMAKDLSGGYVALAKLIWACPQVSGDPHDYLQGVISKSRAKRGTDPPGKEGAGDDDPQMALLRRLREQGNGNGKSGG